MTNEDLPALRASLPDLAQTNRALTIGVDKLEKTVARSARRNLALLVSIAGLVATVLVLTMYYRHLGGQSRGIISRLAECTTAGTAAHPHPCYDEGQARTTDAIVQIGRQGARRQLEIAACDRDAASVAELRRCAAKALPDDLGR